MGKFNFSSSRLRRLSKEGAWIFVGQVAAVLGSLVGVRVLTELLDPAVYGELALGLTIATLLNATILGPLSSGATRFYALSVENNKLKDYLRSMARLVFSATGIVLITMVVAGATLLFAGKHHWAIITVAAMGFAILSGYNSILNGVQNAARQRTIVALHRALEAWFKFLLAAGLIVFFGASSSIVLVAYALAVLLVLASQLIFFRKKIGDELKRQLPARVNQYLTRKEIFEYAWPFATWGIFLWTYMSAGKWSLHFFASTEEVGYFAVLFQLGYYPFTITATMINQFLGPIYFQRAGDGTNPKRVLSVFVIARRIFLFSLVCVISLFLMMLFLHDNIFYYLVSEKFSQISYMLPFMVLFAGITVSAQFYTLALHVNNNTRFLVLPKNIIYLIGTLLIFIGGATYGISGVIGAGVITSIIHLMWIVYLFEAQKKLLV